MSFLLTTARSATVTPEITATVTPTAQQGIAGQSADTLTNITTFLDVNNYSYDGTTGADSVVLQFDGVTVANNATMAEGQAVTVLVTFGAETRSFTLVAAVIVAVTVALDETDNVAVLTFADGLPDNQVVTVAIDGADYDMSKGQYADGFELLRNIVIAAPAAAGDPLVISTEPLIGIVGANEITYNVQAGGVDVAGQTGLTLSQVATAVQASGDVVTVNILDGVTVIATSNAVTIPQPVALAFTETYRAGVPQGPGESDTITVSNVPIVADQPLLVLAGGFVTAGNTANTMPTATIGGETVNAVRYDQYEGGVIDGGVMLFALNTPPTGATSVDVTIAMGVIGNWFDERSAVVVGSVNKGSALVIDDTGSAEGTDQTLSATVAAASGGIVVAASFASGANGLALTVASADVETGADVQVGGSTTSLFAAGATQVSTAGNVVVSSDAGQVASRHALIAAAIS